MLLCIIHNASVGFVTCLAQLLASGADEYFAIFNESNDAVQRALQLLESKKK